jgi:hypothetical protein
MTSSSSIHDLNRIVGFTRPASEAAIKMRSIEDTLAMILD